MPGLYASLLDLPITPLVPKWDCLVTKALFVVDKRGRIERLEVEWESEDAFDIWFEDADGRRLAVGDVVDLPADIVLAGGRVASIDEHADIQINHLDFQWQD